MKVIDKSINQRFMSESEIIKQYTLGKLSDIFIAENCFYMPIRITGTGETLRVNGSDYIIENRQKHLFFAKDILEQCGRLPILLEHPEQDKETQSQMVGYRNIDSLSQIVGQTIHAYIKGDEIWAIGRIYDLNILNLINNKIFSTSPAVSSKCVIIDNISQEIPIEINHIAFVKQGHWDCKSSVAYESDNIKFKEDALPNKDDLFVVDNDKGNVQKFVVEQDKQDTEIVEVPKADEKVVVSHKVEPIVDDTQVIDNEHLPILNAKETTKVEEVAKTTADADVVDDADEVDETTESVEDVVDDADEVVVSDDEVIEIADDDEAEDVDLEVIETQESTDDADVIDEEIIESDEVTAEDRAREKLIDSLNEICDSAHTSLGIKMPYIKKRETTLSIANKFINLNKHLVDKKFQSVINGKLDNMNAELCKDFIASINNRVKSMSASLGKRATGTVDTGRGYKLDSNF